MRLMFMKPAVFWLQAAHVDAFHKRESHGTDG
jgi:hypothetical protein